MLLPKVVRFEVGGLSLPAIWQGWIFFSCSHIYELGGSCFGFFLVKTAEDEYLLISFQ